MKGFPKQISTAQDIENCFELVKAGALEAADLHCALKCIEDRAFLHCPIVTISSDRKKATIRYCNEAAKGAAGNAVIVGVKHETDPDDEGGMSGNAPAFTVLSLEAALPAGEDVIKIPAADPLAEMGIARARVEEIKEALEHEQAIH